MAELEVAELGLGQALPGPKSGPWGAEPGPAGGQVPSTELCLISTCPTGAPQGPLTWLAS